MQSSYADMAQTHMPPAPAGQPASDGASVNRASVTAACDQALALLRAGQRLEALELLDRAVALDSTSLQAWLHRGMTLQELHRPAEALENYHRALSLGPGNIEATYFGALCLHDLGRCQEAAEALDLVIDAYPAFALARIKRGHILRELGHLDEAIKSFDTALSLEPDNAEAVLHRGLTVQESARRSLKLPRVSAHKDGSQEYRGCYINLDRSLERRSEIERQIALYASPGSYQRFAAVDGQRKLATDSKLSAGEIGCYLSHCFLLLSKMDSDHHIHVVEDDAALSPLTQPAIGALIGSGAIDQFDVVFTDSFVQPTTVDYNKYRSLYERSIERDRGGQVIAMTPSIVDYYACTASYVLNRRSIGKVYHILTRVIDDGMRLPVDLAIRAAAVAGKLRIGCLFPFVTSCRIDEISNNTIPRAASQLTRLLLQMGRHSFATDADHPKLCRQAAALLGSATDRSGTARVEQSDDSHRRLLDLILAFCASPLYQAH